MKSHFRFILLSLNKLLCMLRLYSISPTPKTRYKLFSRHINAVSPLECGASRTALNFLECGTTRAALIYSDSVTSPYRCSPPPSDKTTCIATFRNTMMVMLHLKNICFCTRIVQGKLVCSSSTHVPQKTERETIDEESCTHDIRPHTNGLVGRIYSSEPSLINLFRSIMTLFKKKKG